MYTERHNKIGRVFLREIARGRKGGYLVQMDIGSADKLAADGIEAQPREIPLTALPVGMPMAVKKALSKQVRPDALLYRAPIPKTTNAGSRGEPATYWIAEVKCCRDSDHAPQLEKARNQMDKLSQAIKAADPQAQVHKLPLLVGVAGAQFCVTETSLEILGVTGTTLDTVLRKAHFTAIHALHQIYQTKRNQSNRQSTQTAKTSRKWVRRYKWKHSKS